MTKAFDAVHVAFEKQALKTPQAIAVVASQQQITYAALNHLSNQMAHRLIASGVKPGQFVGVCLDRSIAQVASLLAVLKAGATYVPLDPAYPAERLNYMVEDAGVTAMLGTHILLQQLDLRGAPAIAVDDESAFAAFSPQNPAIEIAPDQVIYMIYTSGSTGKPKGALVCHHAFAGLVNWYRQEFEFDAQSVLLHMTSPSFDLTQKNVFAPLACGARVCLLEEGAFDPVVVANTIAQWKVTSVNCTPSAFTRVVAASEADGYRALSSLRHVFLGGEPIVVSRLFSWLSSRESQAQIVNTYGPTECTDVCAYFRIEEPSRYLTGSVPVGFPVPGFDLRVVDEQLREVAPGQEGQLLIAGLGVGKGYHRRPDLTAERFIANPFGHTPGASTVAYLTGDLARRLDDGAIDYLGRMDTQVKVRGFRIELGEIEVVLEQLPAISGAAVAVFPDAKGDNRLAAYLVVAKGREAPSLVEVRTELARRVPEFMVPTSWQFIDALPLTPNGKLDRKALPSPARARPPLPHPYVAPRRSWEVAIAQLWQEHLDLETVGLHDNFFDLGGTSLLATDMMTALSRHWQHRIAVTQLFDNPELERFCKILWEDHGELMAQRFPDGAAQLASRESLALPLTGPLHAHEDIAIIGMSGRFPGALTVEEYWQNLVNGIESTTQFTVDQLDPTIPDDVRNDPSYVKARALIPEAEYFDAGFFGMSPREAAVTDPQQRIFLELAWAALEDAGVVPGATHERVGVYGGVGVNTYYVTNVIPTKGVDAGVGEIARIIATEKDYVANRVSYKLNLTGPAVSIHTACSTGLVAVIDAINGLRLGQCDVALAGGVSVHTPLNSGYFYQEEGVLSPDGISRPFDKNSAGTSFNSGAALVVLKPRSKALADGDRIYAVIKGVGINNDGAGKASFMAPSVRGQMAAIVQAQRDAGIDPRTIRYVEAHGTATPIGDPIEVEALTRAFQANSNSRDKGYCALGSVKSNFGHIVAAAGTAGLIKATLVLKEKQIPPTLHYTEPNPLIDFANSPFYVADRLQALMAMHDEPLRAAVSSFGIGGTNAHVVLEAAAPEPVAPVSAQPQLLLLSARTETQLQQMTGRLAQHLMPCQNRPDRESLVDQSLADVAWTLQTRRSRFAHRRWCVATPDANLGNLEKSADILAKAGKFDGHALPVVFMFPGQGSQYVSMGRGLYEQYELFREIVDRCCGILQPLINKDLRDILFADKNDAAATERLRQTGYTQPALFVIEYALARLWMALGIKPAALIGHSIGEFVAATLAGVFSLEDALMLVARRAALMQAQPGGAMVAVQAPEARFRESVTGRCAIAAVNAAERCVVAGPHDEIDALVSQWESQGLVAKKLHTSHAFHSPMMEDVIDPFSAYVKTVALGVPQIPIMSTVSGEWLSDSRATDPEYWIRHLRVTVRFGDALSALLHWQPALYLEVGPRNTLSTLAAQQMRGGTRYPVLTSLVGTADSEQVDAEQRALLAAVGDLWVQGHECVWSQLHHVRPRVASLPSYPFARDRHWLEPPKSNAAAVSPCAVEPAPLVVAQPLITPPEAIALAANTFNPALNSTGFISMDQRSPLINELRDLFADSCGEDLGHATAETSFLELGFDSLFLTQMALSLKKRFKVDIPFRRLLSDLSDFGSLADSLIAQADASLLPSAAQVVVPAAASAPVAAVAPAMPQPVAMPSLPVASGIAMVPPTQAVVMRVPQMAPVQGALSSSMQDLIQQQLLLMSRQLDVLAGVSSVVADATMQAMPAPMPLAAAVTQAAPVVQSVPAAVPVAAVTAAAPAASAKPAAPAAADEKPAAKPFGAQARIDISGKDDFTATQREHYQQLVSEYAAKTGKSKEYTAKTRHRLSDPRVVSGFRPAVKDITYPIVVERSKGTRLWDIDGNEYIDTLCGYGSMFFGYQPDWIVSALDEQMKKGFEIGPQTPLAYEVTELLSEFLPHERYAFCNTGSEAVLGAMRMTRTRSGRDKIVMFTGDYHGIVDEVIVRAGRNLKSFPAAAGIMPDAVKNMIVLDYGSEESLQVIRENADDIAAVLVETVQSRHPGLVPIEFLKQLRTLTQEKEIALIFDEVITGFRVAPGGFQEYSGIQADICTYGKVIGGGISLGIIAGRAHYLDTLDGGGWEFGDDSKPEVGVTYFAGTFVRHPLAMAAAKAVLLHIKEQGPGLQQAANARAAQFARDMNLHFKRVNAPMEIEQFSSLMYFKFTEDLPWGELMFCDMRTQGIHVWYGRPMFVSTVHTDDDMNAIRNAFMRSLARMQRWGFIPGSSTDERGRDLAPPESGASLGIDEDGNPAWFVPDASAPNGLRQVGAAFD